MKGKILRYHRDFLMVLFFLVAMKKCVVVTFIITTTHIFIGY